MNVEITPRQEGAAFLEALQHLLFADPTTTTFAVLDGASIRDLLPQLAEYKPEHACLYRGEIAPDLAECAPYLVRLELNAPFTTWLLAEGWGNHWGIFATSNASFNTVRIHFRKFLIVRGPQGKRLYFRYYDPRVLRIYLPTCGSAETEVLFGQVNHYICEGERSDVVLSFHGSRGMRRYPMVNVI